MRTTDEVKNFNTHKNYNIFANLHGIYKSDFEDFLVNPLLSISSLHCSRLSSERGRRSNSRSPSPNRTNSGGAPFINFTSSLSYFGASSITNFFTWGRRFNEHPLQLYKNKWALYHQYYTYRKKIIKNHLPQF